MIALTKEVYKESVISSPFLLVFLKFLIGILTRKSFVADPVIKVIHLESYKYLQNYLQIPMALIILFCPCSVR